MSKIDLAELRKRSKYIKERHHPNPKIPLIVWNYNQACQFEGAWDEYTVQARGLVTDEEGSIVARCMKKFFSLGERPETQLENLPLEPYKIYEKIDGSLIHLFNYEDQWHVTSRGSFESDQVEYAAEWLTDAKRSFRLDEDFRDDCTYVFELIDPRNRIVVNYGDRQELVLLEVIEMETGKEIGNDWEALRIGLQIPQCYDHPRSGLGEIDGLVPAGEEGYVIHFPQSGLRVKIKGEEYKGLHRLIFHTSEKVIWEYLSQDKNWQTLLEGPADLRQWIIRKVGRFESALVTSMIKSVRARHEVEQFPERRDKARYILEHHRDISPMVFSLLDGQDIVPLIWKKLKPKNPEFFRMGPSE